MNDRSPVNLAARYFLYSLSPEWQLKLLYRFYHHRKLDLAHPQTLDEKIQWMKLHYYRDNALVRQCADKLHVRDYVASCGLDKILNPLIDVYRNPGEIAWDSLPQRFVLKWNFGAGGNYICREKQTVDRQAVERELAQFGKLAYHKLSVEPQYDVEKRLLCEQFIDTASGGQPDDYKVYCFGGKALYVLCCHGRVGEQRPSFYFFDRNWQLQRFNRQGMEAPEGFTLPKPAGMDDLFRYAEILSKPFPFVRADFYLENGCIWFGELTFTPSGGFDTGRLPETDRYFGSLVELPTTTGS